MQLYAESSREVTEDLLNYALHSKGGHCVEVFRDIRYNSVANQWEIEVKWLGLDDLENTWEAYSSLQVDVPAAEWNHINPLGPEQRLGRVVEFHGSIGDFKELLRHLDEAYRDVDSVLVANGLATMEDPTHDILIRDGDGGKYLVFFSNKALPFTLQDTREAAWNLFKGTGKNYGDGELYNNAVKDLGLPFTIIEDFTKEIYANSVRADIKAKQIVQRHVETNRDVIVFVSRVVPIEIKHKAIFGLTYHLRGYAVTKPPESSTPGHELSLRQLCSRIYIFKEPGVSYESCHSRTL
ncbi:Hypothetical protein PHPALM_9096 [Phytophthora palmivora]|uniref:Chromo domain-containing protein n=1 Tax=Phytophthora palmivora TaxID=4796 RepID=A0A2P4Y867_9STRA|nr:Hypothetical protein PHPALM_9096 [Phytophthora palmivora]